MRSILVSIVAAVLLVGCGSSVDIHQAASDGNIEAVKQHLAAGVDVNAKGNWGSTPLDYAAQEGHMEVAELLIADGADLEAKAADGTTPLHLTATQDHKEVAELLLAKGADVNAKLAVDGGTPLYQAAWGGTRKSLNYLSPKVRM
jgi:ankyrin repeat protein